MSASAPLEEGKEIASPKRRGREMGWRDLSGRREGPRGSEAVRTVPIRVFAAFGVIASRLRGSGRRGLEGGLWGLGALHSLERLAGLVGGEVEAGANGGWTGS